MSLLLKQIFSFFQLLNSDTGTNSLASGLALGVLLGFSPFLSLQTFLVLLIVFFFRVQIGAAFLSAFFFKLIAFLVDPVADILGRELLESTMLRPIWTQMYNMPLIPLTRCNNSIVMGSAVLGLILFLPCFFLFRTLIQQYREQIVQRFQKSKAWKLFSATGFYKFYDQYRKLYGS